ncbi:MAG TPA: hypothetical protein VFM18_20790 [Methanosarcina sp.]|nr:hypothetical protein [Methanosarcina sp.]
MKKYLLLLLLISTYAFGYDANKPVQDSNPLPSAIISGGSAVSATNPIPSTVMTSGSAVSATNPFTVVTEYGSIISNTDHYGTQQYIAPNGELVALPLYKLIGDSFTGPTLDPNFWTANVGTGGSIAITNGELVIATGTTANNAIEVTSTQTARYTGLAPNKFRSVVQLPDTGVVNNVRHWGFWTSLSGTTFQMNGTTFQITTRKGGVDTVVSNGNFNGQWGPTFNIGTVSHVYEIIIQPRQVTWIVDNKVLHTLNANTAPWTEELHLPIHFGSVNSGGLATNVTFSARLAVVSRFGLSDIQPRSAFIQGLNAGTNLKNSPGNLHGVILSGITNNSTVNIYDNTTATGTLIWTSGGLTSNGLPFYLDFKKTPFSVGLSISITGAAMNVLVIYE